MSAFITETVEESPLVLLIGAESPLVVGLVQQFSRQGFETKRGGELALNATHLPTVLGGNFTHFHRIVWILADNQLPDQIPLEFTHLPNLQVVFLSVNTLKPADYDGPWGNASHIFHQKFEKFSKQLPQASFTICWDVLSDQAQSALWQHLTQRISQRVIEYFQVPVYPQTVEEVLPQLTQVLLAGKLQQKNLLRGRNIAARTLAQTLMIEYEKRFGVSVELQEKTAQPQEHLGFSELITSQDSQSWKKIIQRWVKDLPPPQAQPILHSSPTREYNQEQDTPKKTSKTPVNLRAAAHTTLARSESEFRETSRVRVPKTPQPLIENRLKKLEQSKAQAKIELRHRQFLPPARPTLNRNLEKGLMRTGINQGVERELEQQIQHLFGERRVEKKLDQLEKKVKKTKVVQKKNKRKMVLFGLGITVSVLFLGAVGLFGYFQLSRQHLFASLLEAPKTFKTGSGTQIQAYTSELEKRSDILAQQVSLYQPFLPSGVFSQQTTLASLAKQVAQTASLSEQLKTTTQNGVLQVLGKQVSSTPFELSAAIAKGQELYKKLSVLQAEITAFKTTTLSSDENQQLTELVNQLQDQRKVLASLEQIQPFLQVFLGEQGKRNYLVLLQNELELKPTGGTIHAIGLLTFEKGILTNFQVLDTASLTTQLKGEVAAPTDFKAITGQTVWQLKDANWNPDFPETAQQAAWFLEKSTGKKVDGVIAMNLHVLKQLIVAGGPIALPEYNEIITDRNLLERVGFHSEAQLVPAQKYDYLTVLFTKALNQFTSPLPEKSGSLMGSLFAALNTQQLLITMNSAQENETLKNLGWTGEVASPPCPAQLAEVKCAVDTLYINEMNIGQNQVNSAIDRQIEHQLNVSSTAVSHQEIITLRNTATTNAWPLGSYKAYIRLYVPINAQFVGWTINGQAQPVNKLTLKSEKNRLVYGFTVEVLTQQSAQIGVSYSVPLNQPGEFAYAFFDQKQPGTGSDQVRTTIHFDSALRPVLIAPQAEVSNSTIQFVGERDKNRFVGVKFKNS